MEERLNRLTDWLEDQIGKTTLVPEVLQQDANLTANEAYRIQRALMERRVKAGDRIMGYKAALTSKAMQKQVGVAEPVLGTLLASRWFQEDAPVSLKGFIKATLEPEVAVMLKGELEGPGVTELDALQAVEGYFPCVEIGDIRTGDNPRSLQQGIVCNTFNGGHVFGWPLASPLGLDLRTEGMVLTVNGEVIESATAVTVLGNPLRAVAFMANKLAELGGALKPGMVLMTGSIVKSVVVKPGDVVQVDFTRLGQVRVRFTG
ncbi:MAG: fumarylacetoacetate hydrolase family protein [Deltaproteobacteria bacterium]|nr:fumarylacetoacetate hydrolase family protein [Deltaproteobacteria bacterium]